MSSSDIIATLALLVACLAALYARWSAKASQRANQISIHQPQLSIYPELRMLRAILISALTIPTFILTVLAITGIVFLVYELISKGSYNNDWLGFLYAGAVYGYVAVLISGIPTVALGLPACIVAKKYSYLKRGYVITGAIVLGGLFLGFASILLFKTATLQSVLWFSLAGAVGGSINGYVFWKSVKHNN